MSECHKLVLLWSVVLAVSGLDVIFDGEVSVSLDSLPSLRSWASSEDDRQWRARVAREGRRPPAPVRGDRVTAPVPLEPECVYQYPEKKQFHALLSNMMNELTKVFIRVHQLLTIDGNRIRETERSTVKRFKVIKKKKLQFFEEVFKNMTVKFRRFYNRLRSRTPPPADTCASQEKLKAMWKLLLESSLSNLRHGSLLCAAEFLRFQNRSNNGRAQRRLVRFLEGELSRAHSNQLAMLCDQFQLCYSDLL